MANDRQKVINIALAEVGYLEKASKESLDDKTANAGSANYTKYARDLDAIGYFNGRKQGFAWCAVWLCWCFVKAYGKAAAIKMLYHPTNSKNNAAAGCKHARNYFKAKGQLHDKPQIGDQIFFYSKDKDEISHTALVYKVDDKRVYTVEGNTSSASGVVANGGAVEKKSYALTYTRIAGYGRPDYGAQVETPTEKEPEKQDDVVDYSGFETYTVRKGDTLWRIAQKHLGAGNRYKAIMTLNGLSSDKLKVGQVLRIREKPDDEEAASPTPAYTEYTVKKGDSYWKIAKAQLGSGNRYKEIMALNGTTSDRLKIGQKIKIPTA